MCWYRVKTKMGKYLHRDDPRYCVYFPTRAAAEMWAVPAGTSTDDYRLFSIANAICDQMVSGKLSPARCKSKIEERGAIYRTLEEARDEHRAGLLSDAEMAAIEADAADMLQGLRARLSRPVTASLS